MRIVEKLLYGIGGLLALILFLILLCHFNPELAAQIGNSIAGDQPQTVQKEQPAATGNTDENDGIVPQKAQADFITVSTDLPVDDGVVVLPDTENGYTAPEEDSLEIPEAVEGLSGLIPVEGKGYGITESKAEETAKTLSKGNTGEGLTFNETRYPYYQMLNDTGKALYRQIYANAQELDRSFAPVEAISAGQLHNAFMAVCNDHPELFWLNTAYTYQYAPNGSIAEIDLSFNITANQLEESKAKFEAAAKGITDKTYGVYTDYEKEVIVHDVLLDSIVYDKNAPMNQSAYSALVNGRTVCAGYARAFQYVMQKLNVPCYYVTGYAGENHAWNIIKLDDGYYNVDTTWDDTNPNTYDYFNCSDSDYAKDHARRELSVYLPPCNGMIYRKLEQNEPVKDDTQDVVLVGYVVTDQPVTSTVVNHNTTGTATPNTTAVDSETGSTSQTGSSNSSTQSSTTQTRITAHAVSNASDQTKTITTLDNYYLDCLTQLLNSSGDSVTFTNTVDNEKLWNKIVKAYENGDYEEGYATRVLVERHMGSCTVDVTGTLQSDGTYLVKHIFTMR